MTNLTKCQEAIDQDQDHCKLLTEGYFSKANGIINTEDVLLELASTDVCTGIFYASVIKLNESQYVSRYFQHGNFDGYFDSFYNTVKEEFNFEEATAYCVYTSKDIEVEKKRHGNQYLALRKGMTVFKLTVAKNSCYILFLTSRLKRLLLLLLSFYYNLKR